jgi:hypothetical protein
MHRIAKVAAIAATTVTALIATAGSANAATTCQDVPTTTGPATFHATQPSGGGGNWDHTFNVNVSSDGGFTGTNVINGLDAGQTVTVNETVSGQITDRNNDAVKEVTVAAIRNSGFYTFSWSVTDAPMDGAIDSMTVGTTSYVKAENWAGGELPITFTAPVFATPTTQVCSTTPDPVVDKDNHGEYVSGAAHAGVKGNALAAIAKDKTKVGPYPG